MTIRYGIYFTFEAFARLLLEITGDYRPGMKIDTGETELIKIEVVQSQAQKQGSDDNNEDNKNH